MTDQQVPVTITYDKPGTQPPFFVAGSFTDPAWEPHEMDSSAGANGEYVFKKEFLAAPGAKLQYKFRVGHGDWWVLDANAPTVTDALGNKNNLLEIPLETGSAEKATQLLSKAPKSLVTSLKQEELASRSGASTPDYIRSAAEVADSAALLDRRTPEPEYDDAEAGRLGVRRLSLTPIPDVSRAAAEVADSARLLDKDEDENTQQGPPLLAHEHLGSAIDEEPSSDEAENGPPMLAHEDVGAGAYHDWRDTPVQDGPPVFLHEDLGTHHNRTLDPESLGQQRTRSHSIGFEVNVDKFDLNDPTIERFPTDREGILDTVRRLETGLEESQVDAPGAPLSPIIGPGRRISIEYSPDGSALSPHTSPITGRPLGQLEVHPSPDSPRRSASQASLQSIVEETGPDSDDEDVPPVVRLPTPVRRTEGNTRQLGSDEDEGVAMKPSDALTDGLTARATGFQEPMSLQPKETDGWTTPTAQNPKRPESSQKNTVNEEAKTSPEIVLHRAVSDIVPEGGPANGVQAALSSTKQKKENTAPVATDSKGGSVLRV